MHMTHRYLFFQVTIWGISGVVSALTGYVAKVAQKRSSVSIGAVSRNIYGVFARISHFRYLF